MMVKKIKKINVGETGYKMYFEDWNAKEIKNGDYTMCGSALRGAQINYAEITWLCLLWVPLLAKLRRWT
jgi:hypothetical protein